MGFNTFAQADQDSRKARDKNAINTNKKTPVKIIEFIVGDWTIDRVYKGSKDVSSTDAVKQETLAFNREGKYARYSGTEKIDSGSYRVNEDHGLLYLDSETDGPPSEWKVSFTKGTMSMRKKDDSEHAESFRYVYSRNTGNRQSN
jgi:hypothetical protein